MMVLLRFFCFALALFALPFGCVDPNPVCVSGDSLPGSMTIEFADRFELDSLDSLWVVSVNTPENEKLVFEVPFNRTANPRIVILSSVFAGFLYELNAGHLIVGIDNPDFYSDTALLNRVQSGEVKALSRGGALQIEELMALHPDMVIHSGFGALKPELLKVLKKRNVLVLTCNNFLESSPLGRAEWIKFFGAITGSWAKALGRFNEIKEAYLNLRTDPNPHAPKVLVGAMFGGVWDVPGGQSYVAQLIADAGGVYLWNDLNQVGKRSLSMEQVANKALFADVWINPGPFQSRSELTQADARYAKFNAFQNFRVFNHYHNESALGHNAYWERAAARPDWILNDLRLIMSFDSALLDSLLLYKPLF